MAGGRFQSGSAGGVVEAPDLKPGGGRKRKQPGATWRLIFPRKSSCAARFLVRRGGGIGVEGGGFRSALETGALARPKPGGELFNE